MESKRIIEAFYRACLGKDQTFENDRKGISCVLKELAKILKEKNYPDDVCVFIMDVACDVDNC